MRPYEPKLIYHYAIVKELILLGHIYASAKLLVEVNGFEPMTSCVQGRRSPS